MNKRLFINFLQNLALLTLSVTAVLLIIRFPMLEGTLTGRVRELLSSPENTQQSTFDLTSSITAVHFAVTDDYEYGRCTKINASTSGAEFQRISPLFREAIGSAAEGKSATETEFRIALRSPGIYVDLTTVLPMSVVAAWLGEEYTGETGIRALALTTAQETVKLYFLREDGTVARYESALTSSAVRETTATFAPNGGRFAYESDYDSLSPYTILVQETESAAQISASTPAGYSSYNLLTALGFNAHTNARYFESSGTEVVMQGSHLLRIGTDGTVHYSSNGEVSEELYRIPCTGDMPTTSEALRGACRLADALSSGTDAAVLSLDAVEFTEMGWIVSFCYRVNGVRVRLIDERAALQVIIAGDTITAFDYYCRAYTPLQENSVLLPPEMAVAIASMHDNAELLLAYIDNSSTTLSAHWFAQ